MLRRVKAAVVRRGGGDPAGLEALGIKNEAQLAHERRVQWEREYSEWYRQYHEHQRLKHQSEWDKQYQEWWEAYMAQYGTALQHQQHVQQLNRHQGLQAQDGADPLDAQSSPQQQHEQQQPQVRTQAHERYLRYFALAMGIVLLLELEKLI
eukprot:TRINITY_DN26006_c0_g1_i1.p1 TRINITY_DN26006_c0_g1~~TRINITY_DN26006_c0_g1_i1.p1  ORF type:complete len:169 (+),score=24.33 TRINITY_DN26006_c0_g1_i1:55-507(+)